MSEKNGKVIDFDGDSKEPSPNTTGMLTASIENTPFPPRGVLSVEVGDRFRFTFDAAKFILSQPEASTVVVVLSEIKVEDDGSKTLIVVPE